MDTIPSLLIDARNWVEMKPKLLAEMAASGLTGFDIETCDPDRHPGLTRFMSGTAKKLVFDVNRTVVTGFSWYPDGGPFAYYLNLNHADIENRISWAEAKQLLDAKPEGANWIIHNRPFELTMMRKSLGYDLGAGICTMQMAVSTFNEDQYPKDKMLGGGFGGISALMLPISRVFGQTFGELTSDQESLLQQVIGKTSIAQHSYNGFCKDIGYGYGLKKLTKSLFGYDQTSFKSVLNGKAHMGELTGEEVCSYGADDAFWCVKIFHALLPQMMAQNDKLLDTFLNQENPMTEVFSEVWGTGLRINTEAVREARARERGTYAQALREMQQIVRSRLPFPNSFNDRMMELDSWYKKNPTGYRDKITKWAMKDLPDDDFGVIYSTTGPVSDAWAEELGKPRSVGPNLAYYMAARTLMYDLTGADPVVVQGKVSSDDEARKKIRGEGFDDLLDQMGKLANIETRFKLYINPYLMLIDPATNRVYPILNSMLNSHRMAMSTPNGTQLAKRGEGKYVRGFFLADEDDEVIISLDWSQIELVEIGDFSQDPAFADAYGQKPYKDLHWRAVASGLGITVAEAKALPNGKDLRTKVGKGSNFNYWYSGALNTVGEAMGWTSEEMWAKTEAYRQEFAVAEQWRIDLIAEARTNGFVTLPDGHRRVRWEATYEWQRLWRDRWDDTHNNGCSNFGVHFVKKITNRAGNQIVNSMIQGSCATIAKRSILSIRKWVAETGLRARFMMPIHDELVFSVHKDDAVQFITGARRIMCDHPTIIKHLVLDCTASVGRNFEPFDAKKAPLGQIELDEAPEILGFVKDSKLGDHEIQQVINYLFKEAT
jgi:DNA polymerase I-like protein with 3'-5' exonuclease and polymerase domains